MSLAEKFGPIESEEVIQSLHPIKWRGYHRIIEIIQEDRDLPFPPHTRESISNFFPFLPKVTFSPEYYGLPPGMKTNNHLLSLLMGGFNQKRIEGKAIHRMEEGEYVSPSIKETGISQELLDALKASEERTIEHLQQCMSNAETETDYHIAAFNLQVANQIGVAPSHLTYYRSKHSHGMRAPKKSTSRFNVWGERPAEA